MGSRRQQIVEAALQLADEEGLKAVTMRAVADRVGVTPMALYPHVGGKDELLDELLGRVLGELPELDPALPWDGLLREGARAARENLRRHPAVAVLVFQRPAASPAAVRVVEEIYRILLAAGVPAPEVARVERLFSTFVAGYAVSESNGRFSRGRLSTRERRAAAKGDVAAHDALAEYLDRPVDFDAEFERDLDDMIAMIARIGSVRPYDRPGSDLPEPDEGGGMPLDELPKGLSAPARRALDGAGYTRLDQLAGATERELLELHGMGPKAITTIRAALAEHGLALRQAVRRA